MFGGFLTALLVLDAIILIVLIVALQQGNEGGVGAAFGSGNSSGFFGASGGVDFIVRGTWIAGALFFVLALGLSWYKTHEKFGVGRELNENIELLKDVGSEASVEPTTSSTTTPLPTNQPTAADQLTPVPTP